VRILALDTALGATSVALYDAAADSVLAAESQVMERGHAEALIPMVARALAQAGLAFAEIDRIAVTIGPGSFTGIRIGIAAARGFALIHRRPAVGISTLSAYAAPLIFGAERHPVAAAIDARHGMVFFQALNVAGRTIAGPGLYTLEDAARRTGDGVIAFAGNAAMRLAAARKDGAADPRAGALVQAAAAPDIVWVARLGAAADPATAPARPLYLREASVTTSDGARLRRA
jgi:tRNA threonylcarbamoyladenosine biosynthesis protein TsaB